MPESSHRGELPTSTFDYIEKLHLNRTNSTGFGFDEVNFRGQNTLIHRTNNLNRFMMVYSLSSPERASLTSDRDQELVALIDAGLGDAMDAMQDSYPRLFKHAMQLVLDEARLRQHVIDTQERADAVVYQDAWTTWREQYVVTGEKKLVLSMFFDGLAPYVDMQQLTREDDQGFLIHVAPGYLCE